MWKRRHENVDRSKCEWTVEEHKDYSSVSSFILTSANFVILYVTITQFQTNFAQQKVYKVGNTG